MRKSIVAFVALLAATPALAADLPSSKGLPPVPEFSQSGYDWSGAYAGVQVGGVWAQGTYASSVNINSFGSFGGGHAGYNDQFGALVVGVQGEANILGVAGSNTVLRNFYQFNQSYLASVDGRLGYALDNVLFYAIGGAAFTDTTHAVNGAIFKNGNSFGWDVGAGVEYGFATHWSVRVEYRHYDFGSSSFAAIPGIGAVPAHTFAKTDDTFRIGLTYKFGGAEPVLARY